MGSATDRLTSLSEKLVEISRTPGSARMWVRTNYHHEHTDISSPQEPKLQPAETGVSSPYFAFAMLIDQR